MGICIQPVFPKVDLPRSVSLTLAEAEAFAAALNLDGDMGEYDLQPVEVQHTIRCAQVRGFTHPRLGDVAHFVHTLIPTGYGVVFTQAGSQNSWSFRPTPRPLDAPEVCCTASTGYRMFQDLGLSFDPELAHGVLPAATVLAACQHADPASARSHWIRALKEVAEYALSHGITEVAWA
jgi:hypothetical protein